MEDELEQGVLQKWRRARVGLLSPLREVAVPDPWIVPDPWASGESGSTGSVKALVLKALPFWNGSL